MGYTTDFVGHVLVDPPLNEAEAGYLRAFAATRRWDRPGGPYVVLDHPLASDDPGDDVDAHNRPPPGQPGLWCDWVPCLDGHCLAYNGREKFYRPVEWMRYVIDHFLRPGAIASGSGLPCFDGFTFNHSCNGVVAGARRDTAEVFLIEVRDNSVTRRVLVPGMADDWRGELPYQAQIDAQRARRRRRRAAYERNPRRS